MSIDGAGTSDELYHGIGLTFLAISPLIGATVYFVSNIQVWAKLLNGYAGGLLLGFGLIHSLKDGVSGIISDYPYAYVIAGCTVLFLYFATGLIEPFMRIYHADLRNAEALVKLNSYWCALLVHGCFEGLATGGLKGPIRWVIIGVLFPHKIVEYSAMTSSLIIAEIPIKSLTFWGTLMTAEIPTMICFIVAWASSYSAMVFSEDPYIPSDALFASLCAGTFIFLALGHLIPEALDMTNHNHDHGDRLKGDMESSLIANVNDTKVPSATETARKLLCNRLIVYTAIGFGFATFALFALAPDSGNDDQTASSSSH